MADELKAPMRVVLLVEDNDDDAFLMRRALAKAGILDSLVLQVLGDGEEAMAYLAGQGKYSDRTVYPMPDLVLLDLKMPLKDGFEVLKWIREQSALRTLRVVIVSSLDTVYAVNEAYRLGANSFLAKQTDFHKAVEQVSALGKYWFTMSKAPQIS